MKRKQTIRVDSAGNTIRCDDGPESLTYDNEPGIESVEIDSNIYDTIGGKLRDFRIDMAARKVIRLKDGLELKIPTRITRTR